VQPARDANDLRYVPVAYGGTAGFSYAHKRGQVAPYRFRALPQHDRDRAMTDPLSIVATPLDYTPDTVKSRARALILLAMERVESTLSDDANELRLNELAPTIAALGRISGVAQDETKEGTISIHIVRDRVALPEGNTPHVLLEPSIAKDMGRLELRASSDVESEVR
jgi:hypothetical protein